MIPLELEPSYFPCRGADVNIALKRETYHGPVDKSLLVVPLASTMNKYRELGRSHARLKVDADTDFTRRLEPAIEIEMNFINNVLQTTIAICSTV